MFKKKLIIILFFCLLTFLPITANASESLTNSSIYQTDANLKYSQVFVIKSDNSLWSFGYNKWGQVGDGTTKNSTKLKKILSDVASVHQGSYHMVALKTNGEVWCWGSNMYGTIGDGTTTDRFKPKKIMTGVKSVTSSGNNYTVALKKNGEVWVWGNNSRGQLGNGSYKSELKPKKVLSGVRKISAGANHVLALKKNGELWAWGYNKYGQIGNSSTKDVLKPKKIKSKISYILADHDTSLAISNKGNLYIWGCSSRYVFADKDEYSPKKYMSDVKSVSYDQNSLLITKTNNELWTFDSFDYIPYKILDDVVYTNKNIVINGDSELFQLDIYNNLSPVKIMNHVLYATNNYAVTKSGQLWKYTINNGKIKTNKVMKNLRVNERN